MGDNNSKLTKLLKVCLGVCSYFQQMLNNFVNFDFFFSPNFQGLILMKNALTKPGEHAWRQVFKMCSKIEARAIYLIQYRLVGMINEHVCKVKLDSGAQPKSQGMMINRY